MESMFSFKDLEKVTLKSTYNMKIGDREIVPGEIIARFDKIQIANMKELVERISANGGYENRARVYWTTAQAIRISFAQGVFSKEQFGLMTNANIIGPAQSTSVSITEQEFVETNEAGIATLAHEPSKDVFVYDKETGEKISNYELSGNTISIDGAFKDLIVSYTFDYTNNNTEFRFGQELIKGFLELEGRTRIKDDVTGRVVTGIFKIPKLRLMSDLSIRLGENASPVVGSFEAEGVPVGSRGSSYVSEFFILSDDIESDL